MQRPRKQQFGDRDVTPGRDGERMLQPPSPPRPRTRRANPRAYALEVYPNATKSQVRHETEPPHVRELTSAGPLGSALRRALRAAEIDPKMARLVLLFYEWRELRVREIAWRLGVSKSTASRHLDRAEQAGLVDKFYDNELDRRATSGRLTERGRQLRITVEKILATCTPLDPKYGWASGRRAATARGQYE